MLQRNSEVAGPVLAAGMEEGAPGAGLRDTARQRIDIARGRSDIGEAALAQHCSRSVTDRIGGAVVQRPDDLGRQEAWRARAGDEQARQPRRVDLDRDGLGGEQWRDDGDRARAASAAAVRAASGSARVTSTRIRRDRRIRVRRGP